MQNNDDDIMLCVFESYRNDPTFALTHFSIMDFTAWECHVWVRFTCVPKHDLPSSSSVWKNIIHIIKNTRTHIKTIVMCVRVCVCVTRAYWTCVKVYFQLFFSVTLHAKFFSCCPTYHELVGDSTMWDIIRIWWVDMSWDYVMSYGFRIHPVLKFRVKSSKICWKYIIVVMGRVLRPKQNTFRTWHSYDIKLNFRRSVIVWRSVI